MGNRLNPLETHREALRNYGEPSGRILKEAFSSQALEWAGSEEELKSVFDDGEELFSGVVLFDLVDFTSRAGNFTASEVANVLEEYYSIIVSGVKSWKGVIDKFIGDGVLVCVGKPFFEGDRVELSENAVRMCKGIIERGANRGFEIRASFAFGRMFFGTVGERPFESCTMVGHPITKVFRLDSVFGGPGLYYLPGKEGDSCEAKGVGRAFVTRWFGLLKKWRRRCVFAELRGLGRFRVCGEILV